MKEKTLFQIGPAEEASVASALHVLRENAQPDHSVQSTDKSVSVFIVCKVLNKCLIGPLFSFDVLF